MSDDLSGDMLAPSWPNLVLSIYFIPTAFKGCAGIVFTHGIQFARWETVCPGCVSETIRCRKLELASDIGWGL